MGSVPDEVERRIREQWVSIERFGVVKGSNIASDLRVKNAEAIQAAIDFAAGKELGIFVPTGTYEISGTLDASDIAGFRMYGNGPNRSQIIQYTDNVPILKVGNITGSDVLENIIIQGVRLNYATRQTGNTSSIALYLGGTFRCVFRDMAFRNSYTAISSAASDKECFSCEFSNLKVTDWVGWGIEIGLTSGGNSGNVFSNIYMATGDGTHAGALDVTGGIKIERCGQMYMQQINVEWCRPSSAAIYLTNAYAVHISSVNLEGISSRGADGLFFLYYTTLTVTAISMNNNRFLSADGCTKAAVFTLDDRGAANISGLRIFSGTVTGLTGYLFQSEDVASGNIDCSIDCGNVMLETGHGFSGISNMTVNASSNFKRHPVIRFGSAMAINDGVFTVGDADLDFRSERYPRNIRYNSPLTAERTVTLRNTVDIDGALNGPSGADVTIWRSPLATGAFDLLVKDTGGTTLATLSAAGNGARIIRVSESAGWTTQETF